MAAVSTSGGVEPQPVTDAGDELLTVTPVGRLSVIEKFVRFVSPGAVISIRNLELPPAVIDEGENDFDASKSLPRMFTLAFAERELVTPWSVVSAPAGMVFLNVSDAEPSSTVTGTEISQVPMAVGLPTGIVPPVRVTDDAVVVTVPPQVVVAVPATIIGVGRLSVTPTPVYGVSVGFCKVMIRKVVSPVENVEGENRFARPISWTFNCDVAGVALVRFCPVSSALAGIVFMYDPCSSEVTLTVMLHVEFGAMVPLFRVNDVPPGTAVNDAEVPQPVNTGETGSARKTLAGRSSVSEACVRLVVGRLFLISIDRRLVAPAQIVFGLNLLLTVGVGAPVTLSVALAGLVLLIFVPLPVELNAPTGIVLIRLPEINEVTLTDTVQDPGVDPT